MFCLLSIFQVCKKKNASINNPPCITFITLTTLFHICLISYCCWFFFCCPNGGEVTISPWILYMITDTAATASLNQAQPRLSLASASPQPHSSLVPHCWPSCHCPSPRLELLLLSEPHKLNIPHFQTSSLIWKTIKQKSFACFFTGSLGALACPLHIFYPVKCPCCVQVSLELYLKQRLWNLFS